MTAVFMARVALQPMISQLRHSDNRQGDVLAIASSASDTSTTTRSTAIKGRNLQSRGMASGTTAAVEWNHVITSFNTFVIPTGESTLSEQEASISKGQEEYSTGPYTDGRANEFRVASPVWWLEVLRKRAEEREGEVGAA